VRRFQIMSGNTVSDAFVRWLGTSRFQREMCEISLDLAPMTISMQHSTLLAHLFEHHHSQHVQFIGGHVGAVPFLMSCTNEVSFYFSDVAAELFDTGRLPEENHINGFSRNYSMFHSIFQTLIRRGATPHREGRRGYMSLFVAFPFNGMRRGTRPPAETTRPNSRLE
jgi:hypothetical protein